MSEPTVEVGQEWQGRKPYPLRRVRVVEIEGDQAAFGNACFVYTFSILGDDGEPVSKPRRSRSRLGGFLDRYTLAERSAVGVRTGRTVRSSEPSAKDRGADSTGAASSLHDAAPNLESGQP